MSNLTEKLERSIEAAQTGGEFVPAWRLPHDHDLRDVHAMLERVIREQRRIRGVWVLPMPVVP
jgi:hypothetical protein